MPYKRILVLASLLVAFAAPAASAQIRSDTARGLVGNEVRLALKTGIRMDSSDSIILRGSLHLSNPTVFYPERFVAGDRVEVSSYELKRANDSVYSFTVVIAPRDGHVDADDTLCLLAGEALAGYDSVCTIRFTGLRANDGPENSATGVIITHSVGTPAPYVRHATLEQGYPNPARRYQTVTWAFRIDKASPVSFAVYDPTGQRISNDDLGMLDPGVHTKTFEVSYDVSTGAYLVSLTTNSGLAWGWMHVLK